MNKHILEQLLDEAEGIRKLTLQWFIPNSCIITSAVIGELLDRYNVVNFPLVFRVAAFNQIFLDELERLVGRENRASLPINRVNWLIAQAMKTPGAHSVGIGYDADGNNDQTDIAKNSWAGHLVTVALHNDAAYVIDLTADVATRYQMGIVVGPTFVKTDPANMRQKMAFNLPDGGLIVYEPFFNDATFREAPDWTRDHGPYVGAIEYYLKQLDFIPDINQDGKIFRREKLIRAAAGFPADNTDRAFLSHMRTGRNE